MKAYVTKCREPVGILHKSKRCKSSLVVWKSLMYLLGTLGNSCNGLMQTHYATCRKPLGILDNVMRGSRISVGRTVWFGPGHAANTRQDVQVKENHVTIIYNYLRSKKLLFFYYWGSFIKNFEGVIENDCIRIAKDIPNI